MSTKAYAAHSATSPLAPHAIQRRSPRPTDVEIDILFCGVCHSDLHMARNEWGGAVYPVVPGHEILGRVTRVGATVSRFKVGDLAAVGCMVDSCRTCPSCAGGMEQFCTRGATFTYNAPDPHLGGMTYGGYSERVVCDEAFTLKVPANLDPAKAAPLLCAGITLYQPLAEWKAGPGVRVGIVGLGGLGHMGVKIAAAMGAEVTLISHSPSKEADAYALGAKNFLLSSDKEAMRAANASLDLIVNTASAMTRLDPYLRLLDFDGTMVIVGLPENDLTLSAFNLVSHRRRLSGTNNGGIPQTQEMLDFCGKNGLGADIEVIGFDQVNEAWERVVASDVKYRFVLDTSTL